MLEAAKADLEAGKSSYKPPFQAQSTAHSSLSTATAFLTPANGVSVRRKLPRSPTLELTATVQVCCIAQAPGSQMRDVWVGDRSETQNL